MKTSLLSCMSNNIKSKLLERQYDSGSSILLADSENNYVYFLCEGKPVSIIAITTCKVLMLHKSDYIEWLKSDFEAVSALVSILAENSQQTVCG